MRYECEELRSLFLSLRALGRIEAARERLGQGREEILSGLPRPQKEDVESWIAEVLELRFDRKL